MSPIASWIASRSAANSAKETLTSVPQSPSVSARGTPYSRTREAVPEESTDYLFTGEEIGKEP
jgi:hypothetical protein